MEAYARAPDPLTEDNITSNWQTWKEDFIIFMKVTGYIDKPNEVRANLLKNRIGKVGIEAIQNISFNNIRDKDDMDILIEKLDEYFNSPKKEAVERYHFFTRSKKQNESIEQYINILREKAKTCNFKDMTDSIIRDKIILDTHDKILRKKFFEEDNLDLSKLVMIYNDYKINTEKIKEVTKESRTESKNFIPKPSNNDKMKKSCWRCDCHHPFGKCPAWGSKCTKCDNINHFTHCCKDSRFKMNDDKVNKNVLDPMQQANKFSALKKDKWNNQANFTVTTDSMNKTISFPDIPTTSYDAVNSPVNNDSTFDFVNTHNISSKLGSNNITNHAAHLPKSTQYNSRAYTKAYHAKPDGTVISSYNGGQSIQFKPKQMKTSTDTSRVPNNFSQYASHDTLHSTLFKNNQKKKSDKDACILS